MSTAEAMLNQLKDLPPDKQQEVLDFVEFLKMKAQSQRPYPSLYGVLAHLGADISEEDIAEARRETRLRSG